MANAPPLIVLSFEGLATSALSCYGSSWNQTPTIDRLASTGCVWDRFLATSDHPNDVLASWTRGQSDWAKRRRASTGPIELITDSDPSELKDACFDEVLFLPAEPPSHDRSPAEDIADTQFGRLVAAAIERVTREEPWGVLWLHSCFLTTCWDAPRDLIPVDEEPGEGMTDEQEWDEAEEDALGGSDLDSDEPLLAAPPSHFESTVPPRLELGATSHPDLITAWMRTYGCQVRLVDLLLDLLLQTIQPMNPSLLLTGTSGFRMGQGGTIGHRHGPLRSPDIRLPLIVNRGGPLHIPHLTPSDRFGTVLDQLSKGEPSICSPSSWSDRTDEPEPIEIDSDRARIAVSSGNWFYVEDSDHSEHLFFKPDDAEDFNDVGRLRGDVIQMLRPTKKDGPDNP